MTIPSLAEAARPPAPATRAIGLLILVAALIGLASSAPAHDRLLRAFEVARVLIVTHPLGGAIAFVALAALSAMLAFFSSAVLVAPAVLAWGTAATVGLLWMGWMIGGVASYSLARWVGRPAMRVLLRGRSLSALENRFSPSTPFSTILLVQLALPSEIPGCLLGVARHPMGRYLVALAVAELPWAVGTVVLGESFVERRIGALLSLGALVALASIVLMRLFRRRLAGRGAPGVNS